MARQPPPQPFLDFVLARVRELSRRSFTPCAIYDGPRGRGYVEVPAGMVDPGVVSEGRAEVEADFREFLRVNRCSGVAVVAEAWVFEGGITAANEGAESGGDGLPWPAVVALVESRQLEGGARVAYRAPVPGGEAARVDRYVWMPATPAWVEDVWGAQ